MSEFTEKAQDMYAIHSGELSHKQVDIRFFCLGIAFIRVEMTIYLSENRF